MLVVSLGAVGCAGDPGGEAREVVLAGEEGALVAGAHVPSDEEPPPGIALEAVRLELTAERLRVEFVPREDVTEAIAQGELWHLPVWSVVLWNEEDHAADTMPTYSVTVSAVVGEGPGLPPPPSPPAELTVWLCHRSSLAAGGGDATANPGRGPDGSRIAPTCPHRSNTARASFAPDRVTVDIDRRDLAELGERFSWGAGATGGRDGVPTATWSHCIPACERGDWLYPPSEARAAFPGP